VRHERARGGRSESGEADLRIWKFPDQVVRLAILFALAAVGVVLLSQRFVPASFGELGHYRAASLDTIKGQPIRYAGWQVCVECHEEQGLAKSRSYHRNLSCEVCHGASSDHAADPESQHPIVPRARGEACLYCHDYLPSRPTGFPQIIERNHNPMEPCITCHDPHDPTPPSTPASCSACHAEIARTKAVSHHYKVSCETCHEAAPEHRLNPRAHLPRKPTTREFCLRCHGRGADSPRDILRIDENLHGGTYLCWQCHYPHYPES
jgi:hypothetical protein